MGCEFVYCPLHIFPFATMVLENYYGKGGMGDFETIIDGIYQVGGSDLSDPADAAAYIVAGKSEFVMIDCGAGLNPENIVENIVAIGLKPERLSTLILTHCHVDHIGATDHFRQMSGCAVVAHTLDADAIESGDPVLTAANWYKTQLPRTTVDRRLKAPHETLLCGGEPVHLLHTPGHTPGSIAVYLDRQGQRILFGQDIHGPFAREFGSDIGDWRASMASLLELQADILCEGHFGIFRPRERVERYIRGYLDQYADE